MPIKLIDGKPRVVCISLHEEKLTMAKTTGFEQVAMPIVSCLGRQGLTFNLFSCTVCGYAEFYLPQATEP